MTYAKYAYSIKTERVKEPDFPYSGRKITCTSELVNFVRILQRADNEKFVVIYLDTQNKIIGLQVTEGIVDSAFVYHRNVVRQGLLLNAAAMILVHNHPSGEVHPSNEDIATTKRIIEAASLFGIRVHDHLIIGDDTNVFFSMRESVITALIPSQNHRYRRGPLPPILRNRLYHSRPGVSSPSHFYYCL